MNRYAQVLIASALAYTAQASSAVAINCEGNDYVITPAIYRDG